MKLQKKIDSLRETPSTLAKYSNSNQYTTFQLEGLKKESLTLKREMYAMKVLKVADDQKLRVLQGNLFDLEKRVFEMKGMNAELQFKLDEMSIDKKETTDTGGEPLRLNVVKVRSNDKVNEPSCEIDDILGSAVSSIKPLTKDKVEQEEPPKTSKVKSIHVTKKVQSECKQQ